MNHKSKIRNLKLRSPIHGVVRKLVSQFVLLAGDMGFFRYLMLVNLMLLCYNI